jgi:hypothetical protein
MNPRHPSRSRFLAAENKVNELLLKGVNIEEHWKQRDTNKKNTEKEVRGLSSKDKRSTEGD